jgi:hypothetical protein
VQSRNAPPVFARKYLKVQFGGSIARRSLPKARYDDLFALETVVRSCPWLKLEVRKYEIVDGPRKARYMVTQHRLLPGLPRRPLRRIAST